MALESIRIRSIAEAAAIAQPEKQPSPGDTELVNKHQRRDRRRAGRLLSEMPEHLRSALDLASLHGMTPNEISEQTGIPMGTVKSRIRLGLNWIRKRFDDQDLHWFRRVIPGSRGLAQELSAKIQATAQGRQEFRQAFLWFSSLRRSKLLVPEKGNCEVLHGKWSC